MSYLDPGKMSDKYLKELGKEATDNISLSRMLYSSGESERTAVDTPQRTDKSAKSDGNLVNNISATFFNVKNFIFKIIVPVVLISTFLFIANIPSGEPAFYRNHGNKISNHNDGTSPSILAGES